MKFNNEYLALQFLGLEACPALEQRVKLEYDKLLKMAPRLMRCRVSISKTHLHHRHGAPFEIHVELIIPGSRELVAAHRSDEDAYVALKAAFSAAHQQLERLVGRQKDRPKLRGLAREIL